MLGYVVWPQGLVCSRRLNDMSIHEPFDPPALPSVDAEDSPPAVPGVSRPMLTAPPNDTARIPSPPPSVLLTVMTLPSVDVPILPPASSQVPSAHALPSAPTIPTPTAALSHGKQVRSRGRVIGKRLAVFVILGGLGAGGFLAYQAVTATGGTDDLVAAPAVVPESTTALNTANDVIGQTNGGSTEPGSVGLDPLGAPGRELDAASYHFVWTTAGELPVNVWIDGSTQNWQIQSPDLTMRRVDGQIYATPDPSLGWNRSTVPGMAEQTFLGLDRFVTVTDAIPTEVTAHLTSTTIDRNGFGAYVVDDRSFASAAPAERARWFQYWGLDATQPASGSITIDVSGTPDGIAQRVLIDAAESGGLTSYELIEVFDVQYPIEVPDNVVS